MANAEIKIICEKCGKLYSLFVPPIKKNADLILDFAVCPYCHTPRNPSKVAQYKKDELCARCGIPKNLKNYTSGARGLCGRCYVELRRLGMREKYPKNR